MHRHHPLSRFNRRHQIARRQAIHEAVLREMGLPVGSQQTVIWDRPPRRRRGRANSHPAVVLPIMMGIMISLAGGFFPVGMALLGFGALALRARRARRKRAKAQVAQAARNATHTGAQRQQGRVQTAEPARAPALDPNSLEGLKAALKTQENDRGAGEAQRLIELTTRLDRPAIDGGITVPPELQPAVTALFDAARGMLRKVVRLGTVSTQLSTPEAREESGALLTELLDDLEETHDELAHTLDRLQLRSLRSDRPERDLDRLRKELDAQLDVARRVDERLDMLDHDISPDVMDRTGY